MKKQVLKAAIIGICLCVLVNTAYSQQSDTDQTQIKTPKQVTLSGPRVGITLLTGKTAKVLRKDRVQSCQ